MRGTRKILNVSMGNELRHKNQMLERETVFQNFFSVPHEFQFIDL